MSKRAKYCKCKNTYTIKGCDNRRCNQPYYWGQGIGSTTYDGGKRLFTFDRTDYRFNLTNSYEPAWWFSDNE